MKKKYNIQLSNLEKLLDMLSAYQGDETVDADITTLKKAIVRLKNDFTEPIEESLLERMALDLSLYEQYLPLYTHVTDFLKKGLYFSDAVNPDYKSILLTDDETIELCRDFYKEQGTFFSSALDDYIEDIEDHLMFFKPNDNSDGEIHFIESTGDAYVMSPDHQNIKKPSVLIHESEHVIDSFNNPKFYRNLVIREVTSMFMEMIGCDYLAKVLKLEEDHLFRRFHIHSIVKSSGLYIPDKMEMLKAMNAHTNYNEQQMLEHLEKAIDYDKDYVNYLLESNIVQDHYYVIAYMIAIELYEIYNIDKDLALHIVQDIILNGNDFNIFSILKKYNIVINTNVVKYEDDMCLKLGI
jgi:hypothetical protein